MLVYQRVLYVLMYNIADVSTSTVSVSCIHRTSGQGGFSLPSAALCALWRDLQLRLETAFEGTHWPLTLRTSLIPEKRTRWFWNWNWHMINMDVCFKQLAWSWGQDNVDVIWCLENIGSANSPSLPFWTHHATPRWRSRLRFDASSSTPEQPPSGICFCSGGKITVCKTQCFFFQIDQSMDSQGVWLNSFNFPALIPIVLGLDTKKNLCYTPIGHSFL